MVILHSNIRGYTSKKEAFYEVVKDIDADVCILNETGLKGKNKVIIPGYTTFFKNREVKNMGGISTSIKDKWRDFAVNVGQGSHEDEYIITRLDNFKPAICIINCYGEQESRTCKEEIEARWSRLRKELDKIKARGEGCLLIGDLNKQVGSDDLGVAGNHSKVSIGGRLVRELLATKEYCLINNMDVAEGGPFTRKDPVDGKNESCLDLFICSSNLRPFIHKLLIDSDRKYAMKRATIKHGVYGITFTDHFTMVLYMKNLPSVNFRMEKVIRWNLMKEGGWDRYKDISDMKSIEVDKLVTDKSKTIEVLRGLRMI